MSDNHRNPSPLPVRPSATPRPASLPSWSRCHRTIRPATARRHAERAAELARKLGLHGRASPCTGGPGRANGMVSATNLVVRTRFGDGPVIALNAHGDVVPPGEGWTRDPFGAEIVDGWMYGRGVAVSKSRLRDLRFCAAGASGGGGRGRALDGTIELHFTYDEEAGGEIGPGWLLEEGISKPDYALGAGFSYGVVNAHNGCLHLEVAGRRPLGPRRDALHRRRCARGRDPHPVQPLRVAQDAGRTPVRHRRHRQPRSSRSG